MKGPPSFLLRFAPSQVQRQYPVDLLKINPRDNLPENLLKLLVKLVEGEARASEQVTGENLELEGFRPGSRVPVYWGSGPALGGIAEV